MSATVRPSPVPALDADPLPDLDALTRRRRDAVWRYLRVLGCDATQADDLTQEVFLVVLRRAGFDAGDPRAAFAFLRTTARHLYLKSLRRRPPVRAVEEADRVWDERCAGGDGDERIEALRACLRALPERSRALLQATYGDGEGRRAVGRRFGLGADGVKSALRRLRAFLHACIESRQREARP